MTIIDSFERAREGERERERVGVKALLEFLGVTLKLSPKPAVPLPLYSSFS